MIKIYCIKRCYSYLTGNPIKPDSVLYTPIIDINEAYTNWISIYSVENDISSFIGTYQPQYFGNLAQLRESRINRILGDL